ncbi:hypothetical protein CGLO_13545 [Colletotrichum gloeosporioides Cg-14]|uniref:Uncharacterized protein n=1 Tax=Colletotrichum gloeosporioides (strain Cg-14) TaxID=1237896 RepID=T0K607_COLGC|nr:hypothetical protein CGLO_13545 [Colletotrichum gloeosporioides Cg-14]
MTDEILEKEITVSLA